MLHVNNAGASEELPALAMKRAVPSERRLATNAYTEYNSHTAFSRNAALETRCEMAQVVGG